MQIGLMAPQGWKGEYDGWEPAAAWSRTIELSTQAEALGFESLWVFDHFHTVPQPSDEITFESFSMLSALAMATDRVRLGHMVVCTGFRNPALTAKMASTIDVISGGRFELGIGAGWKEEEWRAYGYGFPTLGERMTAFGDHLEVIRAMLGPGRATFEGKVAHVRGAINVPKGLQTHIPIIVGGNGERVTAGYAIRHADELNYVFLSPAEIALRIPAVRARCEAEGRDPSTLRFSLYARDEEMRDAGQARIGFVPLLVSLVLTILVLKVPAAHDMDPARLSAFETVMGGTPRIWLGGIAAYGISTLLNVSIFTRLKAGEGAKLLWLRSGIASVLSQIVDTLIFITIAFYGVFPIGELLLGQMLAKVVLSAVLVPPLVYLFVALGRNLDAKA